jgi:hypothetical protein
MNPFSRIELWLFPFLPFDFPHISVFLTLVPVRSFRTICTSDTFVTFLTSLRTRIASIHTRTHTHTHRHTHTHIHTHTHTHARTGWCRSRHRSLTGCGVAECERNLHHQVRKITLLTLLTLMTLLTLLPSLPCVAECERYLHHQWPPGPEWLSLRPTHRTLKR